MIRAPYLCFVVLFLLVACKPETANVAAVKVTDTPVVDLKAAVATGVLSGQNTSLDWVSGPSEGLHVRFNARENAHAGLVIQPRQAWDWSAYESFNVAFEISNPGEHSVQLFLTITDQSGASYTRSASIAVGPARVYYAKLAGHDLQKADDRQHNDYNFESGLRSNPDSWHSDEIQFTSMWGKQNLDTSAITKISVSLNHVLHDKEIIVHKIVLRPNPPLDDEFLTNIVDQYGQNAKQDFEGKVHSDSDLKQQRDAERESLRKTVSADRSKWGGWLSGPRLTASGYFRAEKVDGKWSLVDPDGYLYFATGVDIIRLANSTTITGYDFPNPVIAETSANSTTPEDSKGLARVADTVVADRFVASELRKNMFRWLPEYSEPLGKHYGYRQSTHSGPLPRGETYSFYSANLERKYADINPDFMAAWRETTVDRMLTWGFTSLGNWTDPDYYDNNRIPYFANGWIIGDFKTISSGSDFWAPLPDVFDPVFAQRADVTARQIAAEVKDSPWCVGVFVDNEKGFGRSETNELRYGIVINALARDGRDVPTKAEFTRQMREKYASITALNTAWGVDIEDWESFDRGFRSSINNPTQLQDYAYLLGVYADKYFSTVDQALERYLPNHMYLGSRFADWGMPMEVVQAAAKHVDVVSYNIYKEGIHPASWGFLEELDKPSIIGEFHMGASDSGLFHGGLVLSADQEDRAKMYREYMQSVIDNPYFIGAHWFQYMDSPITGRALDGENYNNGFVSVADVPYQPMVKAARSIHRDMYQRRFGKQ
ncbi:MAG: agarase [Gammaproteobacteria bacterium]|nr:agarase [Gammaproteobacteria bacterium]